MIHARPFLYYDLLTYQVGDRLKLLDSKRTKSQLFVPFDTTTMPEQINSTSLANLMDWRRNSAFTIKMRWRTL